jgi:predicted ATPase
MLTEINIKNFKAWEDTGPVRLAPLTVIFGANSSGKSSLGHLLLALKQTTLLSDRKRALHLGDESTLIDLGTYSDCIYKHDLTKTLEFSLKWRTSAPLSVRNSVVRDELYEGDSLRLTSKIRSGRADQPEVQSIEYTLFHQNKEILTARHARGEGNKTSLTVSPLKLVKAAGRVWPLEAPEKFYRFSDVTLARFQNADFLANFALDTERMLGNLYYLGPLRSHPKRIYQWSGDVPSDVGSQGEFAIAALLAADSEGRRLNRGPNKPTQGFSEFIGKWLTDLGIIHSFEVKPVAEGRKEYEVLIKTREDSPEVKLTDVGFGVSQVLPALVESFYAPPNSIVWMEQPEIHLHPQVQAELADVLISATQAREKGKSRNVQLIIESHSEHLLTRLQRRVSEGLIKPEDVAIYFAQHGSKSASLEPLRIDLYGEIDNWPTNFFGDEIADVQARTLHAMQRKKRERDASN